MNHLLKRTFFSLILIVLIAPLKAQTGDINSNALSTYLEAENAFMQEDYSQAFTLYQKVLENDKDFDPAMFQLARIYLFQNNTDQAYKWAQEAYNRDNKNKWYALLLIDLFQHKNKLPEAIDVYQKLLIDEPDNLDYLNAIAPLYELSQRNDEAIETYNRIEMQKGVSERLSFKKRDLYLNSSRFDKAISELLKLSEKFPQDARYASMIAEMYMRNKETDKAFLFYQKVLDINPSDPYIRITLSDFYQQKGEIDLAFENLQMGFTNPKLDLDTKIQILGGLFNSKSIPEKRLIEESFSLAKKLAEVHHDKPGAHAIYADLLYRDSLFSEAAIEYYEVIKIDSSKYSVWEQLLFSLNGSTNTERMIEISNRTIKLFPRQPLPYLFNAIGYFVEENVKNAIQSLEKGLPLAQNPKLSEQFYMYLGDAYYQDEQSDKAFDAYDKCLSLNPSNTFVLNNYAYYLALKDQNLAKAKTMAFTAISIDPGPTNHDTYGWVLYQTGNYEEALKYIEMAVEGDKNPSAEVYDHLGDVYFRLGKEKKAFKFWKKAKKKGLNSDEFIQKLANGL